MAETSNGADAIDPYVEKIEALIAAFDPKAGEVSARLFQLLLDIVRHRQKPWQAMLESDQFIVSTSIATACDRAVREIFRRSIALNHIVAAGKILRVTIDDKGVELKTRVDSTDSNIRHTLGDLQGAAVPMVLTDWRGYIGDLAAFQVVTDEPGLPLGDQPDAQSAVQPDAEERVDQDLDTIIAGDETGPKPGQIGHLTKEREAVAEDPFAAGKAVPAE